MMTTETKVPHDFKQAEEATIRSYEEQERLAVLNEDVVALEQLWSEQFIVNNPQNQITVSQNDALNLVRRSLISYSSFERRIELIRIHQDLAVVMGAEKVVRKGDATSANQPIQRRFTNIWRKSDTTWRMIARHASVILA